MLRGPDRLHFSSTEILLKITYANHVFLIKDNALIYSPKGTIGDRPML